MNNFDYFETVYVGQSVDENWCPNCGEMHSLCQCTEEDMNRWAHEVLYGEDDRRIQRHMQEEYDAWWLANYGEDQ